MKNKNRKKLGQHFLKNKFIIKNIINTINPKIKDCLVEIGPGLGALTWPISQYVKNKMVTIELDKNMVILLKNNKMFHSKIDMYNCNVMIFNFKELSERKKKNYAYSAIYLIIFQLN